LRLNEQREGTVEATIAGALAQLPKERVLATKAVLKALAAALEDDASS
jgi:hypothetical protein